MKHNSQFLIIAIFFLTTNFVNAQNWDQIIKFSASNRGFGYEFGYSVSISGDYAIVGARWEFEGLFGRESLGRAGSAYIFKNIGGKWAQIQKIVSPDREEQDWFGYSVSISNDYAIVGAYREDENISNLDSLANAGSVYIFKNNDSLWVFAQKIVASDRGKEDHFGISVSISDDYLIVGAEQESEDASGENTLNRSGSAYIFKNIGGRWSQVQKIVASDRGDIDLFGISVSISGYYVIVGARREDEDLSGGNTITDAGSAYIFKNSGGIWSQVQKIVASDRGNDDRFGYSVSISGDYAIVGAFFEDEDESGGNTLAGSGSAYIFKNNDSSWSQVQKIVASDRGSNDWFGYSVSISGDYAIVGAQNTYNLDLLVNAGSAYILKNIDGTWSELKKIIVPSRERGDQFGNSVAISGDNALVGAYHEDHDPFGGHTINNSGSVYFLGNVATSVKDKNTLPNNYLLNQNYPNPFNPSTTIRYSIPIESEVSISVYNILGAKVEELFRGRSPAGNYEVNWNASNFSSGIYFLRMNAVSIESNSHFADVKKLILLK